MELVEKYNTLFSKYKFKETQNDNIINQIVVNSLVDFISKCTNPAIWCYGLHTTQLMKDFIFELKRVKYIIDKNYKNMGEHGYHIIGGHQVGESGIDGIIISSFRYREEIKDLIKRDYPDIAYLDVYEELEKHKIVLDREYFCYNGSPYNKYKRINQLKRLCAQETKLDNLEKLYLDIINEHINMMDFQSAIERTQMLQRINDKTLYQELRQDLEEIYRMELDEVSDLSQNNVIMFCVDGLRGQDVLGNNMPNLRKYLMEQTCFYTNAYSLSTSTFESLIPAYSENTDLRTKYYESNVIEEKNCRFIAEAIRQNRNIFFYTDATKYIESERINVKQIHQTATEKIWNFVTDAEKEQNGLFYIHVLFESHFSYANPDTEEELVLDGTGIAFDLLEENGGRIRADYVQQHTDAIKYLDRVLVPFLEQMPCRLVFYADHGNVLIPKGLSIDEVDPGIFSCNKESIHVPLAIKSPEMDSGVSDNLISIMSLNEIICSLLQKKRFVEQNRGYIKTQRSAIYNPETRYLLAKMGLERELRAYEMFIFENLHKLTVYDDGFVDLKDQNDELLTDQEEQERLFDQIRDDITVTDRFNRERK